MLAPGITLGVPAPAEERPEGSTSQDGHLAAVREALGDGISMDDAQRLLAANGNDVSKAVNVRPLRREGDVVRRA